MSTKFFTKFSDNLNKTAAIDIYKAQFLGLITDLGKVWAWPLPLLGKDLRSDET